MKSVCPPPFSILMVAGFITGRKGLVRVEDKFGRRRPMFLPIYHSQTYCRISIERLAMRKGSLMCTILEAFISRWGLF